MQARSVYSRIAGTGSYLPEKIVTNTDLEKMVNTTAAWILERTGIERRHVVAPEQSTLDMVEHAALREAKCALVIGAECVSKLVDWTDRNTCVLFGDGAGAVVLKPSTEQGIISTHLHADGEYSDLLFYPTGPSCQHNPTVPDDKQHAIIMKGTEVFKVAVNKLSSVVDETLAANDLEKSAIDWLVPHQANLRIIQAIAKKLDLPPERVIVTVQDHGNTSAASVPLALDTDRKSVV